MEEILMILLAVSFFVVWAFSIIQSNEIKLLRRHISHLEEELKHQTELRLKLMESFDEFLKANTREE